MPKPDKALRTRPLVEVKPAVEKLKRVVLFHPEEISLELMAKMCVCGQDERTSGTKTNKMIQCDKCWEWFHYDCVSLADDYEPGEAQWNCEWCTNGADDKGKQRWKSNRKKAKLRDIKDLPRLNGAVQGGDHPVRYSSPPSWEGKVAEVKDLSQRMAVKKRKLKVAVQALIDESGHHLTDAEGMHGTEARPGDDGLVDEMIGAGFLDPEEMGED